MNNKTKEIIAIYLISVYIAGLAYIGLRRAYVVENSIKIYFLFVLSGILIGTVITALNTCYRRYKEKTYRIK